MRRSYDFTASGTSRTGEVTWRDAEDMRIDTGARNRVEYGKGAGKKRSKELTPSLFQSGC